MVSDDGDGDGGEGGMCSFWRHHQVIVIFVEGGRLGCWVMVASVLRRQDTKGTILGINTSISEG